jgi:hypothetical protein
MVWKVEWVKQEGLYVGKWRTDARASMERGSAVMGAEQKGGREEDT